MELLNSQLAISFLHHEEIDFLRPKKQNTDKFVSAWYSDGFWNGSTTFYEINSAKIVPFDNQIDFSVYIQDKLFLGVKKQVLILVTFSFKDTGKFLTYLDGKSEVKNDGLDKFFNSIVREWFDAKEDKNFSIKNCQLVYSVNYNLDILDATNSLENIGVINDILGRKDNSGCVPFLYENTLLHVGDIKISQKGLDLKIGAGKIHYPKHVIETNERLDLNQVIFDSLDILSVIHLLEKPMNECISLDLYKLSVAEYFDKMQEDKNLIHSFKNSLLSERISLGNLSNDWAILLNRVNKLTSSHKIKYLLNPPIGNYKPWHSNHDHKYLLAHYLKNLIGSQVSKINDCIDLTKNKEKTISDSLRDLSNLSISENNFKIQKQMRVLNILAIFLSIVALSISFFGNKFVFNIIEYIKG